MNTCRKVGIASRASAPSDESSVGTSRQPSTVRPSASTIFSHRLARRGGVARRLRQEGDARGVAARLGQLEVDHGAQELVGNLKQDARAVAGVRFGALGAAVLHVQQRRDGLVDDVAAATAVHVGDHRDTTRVVLVGGVVQPLELLGAIPTCPFTIL